MRFEVPVAEATPLIEEARALLDGPADDLIAEHGRDHGHEANQNPDGSLVEHVRQFKHSMHRLGPMPGSTPRTSPNVSADGVRLCALRCTCKRRSFCVVSEGSSGSSPGPMAQIL
jgi:hypothetical protein